MENKILLKNKDEFIRMLKEESGNISHYILYSILLSFDEENPTYLASMMTLTTKLAMLSKSTSNELTMSRKEYHELFKFFKSENDVFLFISHDDDINWTIDFIGNKKEKELAKFYYRIYSKAIDYIASLFSQERFINDYLDEYPLACALDHIFASKGNIADFDPALPFYEDDFYFKFYYPQEWKEDFCVPLSCDLDLIASCSLGNEFINEIMENKLN